MDAQLGIVQHMARRPLLSLVLVLIAWVTPAQAQRTEKELAVVAFGSCIRQDKPQPIWRAVINQKPDLFLLLGDNIYGDTRDMSVLKTKYDQQRAVPEFQELLQACPTMGVWDDHDYGENDAGEEFPMKEPSKRLFLEFMNEPADSPRWTQQGVYTARVVGPVGRRVQIILLDTRWSRSALTQAVDSVTSKKRYVPTTEPAARVLDEAQWAWLEQQLSQPAELRLVCSSIQVIAEEQPFEKWSNFPAERARLLNLISRTKANGVIFLSGDRHFATLDRLQNDRLPYPIHDFTASGMTHSFARGAAEAERHRLHAHSAENFGVVRIDWQVASPTVTLEAIDIAGKTAFKETVELRALSAEE